MTYFTRQRLVFWGFVLLVVMNISALATVWYQREGPTRMPAREEMQRRTTGVNRQLRRQLDLSESQARLFADLQRAHFERVHEKQEEIRELKNALFQELTSGEADSLRAEAISNEIGRKHADLERLTFHHFLELKRNCSPEQQERLTRLFHRMQLALTPRPRSNQRQPREPQRRREPAPQAR